MQTQKDKILDRVLAHVVFDGWTPEVFTRAGQEAGISAGEMKSLFPKGLRDLVWHFHDWSDRQMLARMEKTDLKNMRVRDRVALGVQSRLEVLVPHKEAVRKGLSYLSFPPQCFVAPKLVWKTADRIWWQAGDTATDYNHYSKRILLSGVISKTTLYWLNDESDNHENTWQFLDRRIETVLKIGKQLGKLKRK